MTFPYPRAIPVLLRKFFALSLASASLLLVDILPTRGAFAADEKPEILITYQGVGTYLTYAIGVSEALYESYDAIRDGRVVLTGNSGGAVLAGYFACHGLTPESLKGAADLMAAFPSEIVNEDAVGKAVKILLKRPIEDLDHAKIKERLALVIPEDCQPKLPLVIGVGNAEVNERRVLRYDFIVGNRDLTRRKFDETTYLVTDDQGPIGKACTYFATPEMFERLEALPREERLCDLRLVKTAEDVRFAILATVSEPTYYAPLAETAPDLLVKAYPERTEDATRYYNGGFILPGVARDVMKVMPDLKGIGTGRPQYWNENLGRFFLPKDGQARILREWFGISINQLVYREQTALDLVVPLTSELVGAPRSKNPAELARQYAKEISVGRSLAKDCFAAPETCKPLAKADVKILPPMDATRYATNPVDAAPLPDRDPEDPPVWDLPLNIKPL